MAKIYNSLPELVGNTPLVRMSNYSSVKHLKTEIIAKVEYFNPAGSVKDRLALNLIEDAEEQGLLKEGYTIVEPTSGNTGIGLAFIGASRGYKVILTMPDSLSIERRQLLKMYGAEVVLTDGKKGMKGSIAKALEIASTIENSFVPSQFDNKANPMTHIKTTGPEIWNDTDGEVDIFIGGVGTGGTITGVSAYLKEQNPNVKIIAVEPKSSSVISGNKPGPHSIQGIGAGFIPSIFNMDAFDEVIQIENEDAFVESRLAATTEGLLVGISSGAALKAASIVASREENKGKTIVVLLPDTGERYLSTDLFKW